MLRVAFDLDLTEKTPTVADVTLNTTISPQEEGSVRAAFHTNPTSRYDPPHPHRPDTHSPDA